MKSEYENIYYLYFRVYFELKKAYTWFNCKASGNYYEKC